MQLTWGAVCNQALLGLFEVGTVPMPGWFAYVWGAQDPGD